jgi:site-specific DNA recombinase
MNTQRHTNSTKTAIGYVRVSTQEQASDGVSLDAQRDKLRAYCKVNGIKLIDIKADEGYSGSTLDRPGLQAALQLIRRGRVNTLIVAKLDRLSRSLRDVCSLVEELFSDERNHLLSLCGMVNTHTPAGRMLMMNLANYNQFEREMIAERTRDALQHMKAQGVRLGHAPYGYEHGKERDERGRRQLVPIPKEQEVIAKIKALHAEKLSFTKIARRLNELGIPAKRGGRWVVSRVCTTLQREGAYKARTNKMQGPLRHDREAATEMALRLRAEGMSLNQIGMRLRKERLTPLRGGKWHAAQVAQLLRKPADRNTAARRACELRAEGMTLKEIGVRLTMEGFQREDGGVWYPSLVHGLILSAESEREDSPQSPQ